RYEIEAEGKRMMNESLNVLSPEARGSEARLRVIDRIEGIIRESVKPMESIESIKILHVDGLGGGGGGQVGPGGETQANFSDSVVNSALRYRAQAPLVDSLLKEIGLQGGDLGQISKMLEKTGPKEK